MDTATTILMDGQARVPPGFRFHPTEEELLNYYLRKKVVCEKIDLDVIHDVDLNKLEPWEIQEKCNLGSTTQSDWYFFSHKDRKYPTGTRTNRATTAGFWKATGRDKVIYASHKLRIGMRKTLVFYKGRAPHGQKSEWIMHEYRLEDQQSNNKNTTNTSADQAKACRNYQDGEAREDGWVVCRVFRKKNFNHCRSSHYYKFRSSSSPSPSIVTSNNKSATHDNQLEQIFENFPSSGHDEAVALDGSSVSKYLSGSMDAVHLYGVEEKNSTGDSWGTLSESLVERVMNLPALNESSSSLPNELCELQPIVDGKSHDQVTADTNRNWTALDRLVAFHLNGELEERLGGGTSSGIITTPHDNDEMDLWTFAAAGTSGRV